MKTITLFLLILLTGCTANYTTQSFVFQDQQLEPQLNLLKIQSDLTEAELSAAVSEVSLTADDGITLRGIKLINKEALINIVFFSANGMKISTSSKILNKFAMLPANIIWFDYRGVGISDKKDQLTINSLQKDALSIFEFSLNHFPDNLPVAVHGLSMGSLIASYVANNKHTDALILDGAINSVPSLVDNLIPIWSKPFYSVTLSKELSEITNVDSIKQYNKPLLLLVGENDSVTPVEHSKTLYDMSPSQMKVLAIIPGTEHGESMKKEAGIRAYQSFIKQMKCCSIGG